MGTTEDSMVSHFDLGRHDQKKFQFQSFQIDGMHPCANKSPLWLLFSQNYQSGSTR